ncbi:hypothetical protein Sjap_017647 [Stephania japonica]|uniref:Uncharacterized protein n=1 Tax=Stephania japonica TaxID=461633 RepID=A0AAP0I6K7_9MAGN
MRKHDKGWDLVDFEHELMPREQSTMQDNISEGHGDSLGDESRRVSAYENELQNSYWLSGPMANGGSDHHESRPRYEDRPRDRQRRGDDRGDRAYAMLASWRSYPRDQRGRDRDQRDRSWGQRSEDRQSGVRDRRTGRCVHKGLVGMDWLMSSPGIDFYTRS